MITPRGVLPTLLLTTSCGLALWGCGTDPRFDLELRPGAITLATPTQVKAGEVIENSYIVAFRAPTGSAGLRFPSFMGETRYHFGYLAESYLVDSRVKDLRYITTLDLAAKPDDAEVAADFALPQALQFAWDAGDIDGISAALARVDFADAQAGAEALTEWDQGGELWYAEPNYVNYLQDENPYTTKLAEDYKAASIHWHNSIKLPDALAKLAAREVTSAQAPVIAVLDSGVDVENPALAGRIWVNPSPGASGCPGDEHGCDTTLANRGVLGSGNVNPYLTTAYGQECPGANEPDGSPAKGDYGVCQHGTHVAGIIGAGLSGELGGVCPVCQIMAIKIITSINGRGAASDDAILSGFKYLTLFGTSQKIVRVANSSFGKYVRARSVALLVNVLKKKPVELLVVGAAGNEDSMVRSYPAALNDAIAVGAVDNVDGKAKYSNFGPWVDVSAPGGDTPSGLGCSSGQECIASTVPGPNGTGYKKGTSMAAPVVAGIAGLILSVDPTRSFLALRSSIVDTSDCRLYSLDVNGGINRNSYYPKIEGESARRPLLGSGIVDAAAAIEATGANDCQGSSVRRVSRNCSVVGGTRFDDGTTWALLFMPLAALLVLELVRRAQVNLRRHRGHS